jgi:hypothetical protein
MTHSGCYFDERGNRSETNRLSEVMWMPFCRTIPLNLLHNRRSPYLAGTFSYSFKLSKRQFPKWVTANGQKFRVPDQRGLNLRKDSRGDWTPLVLFIAGVRDWEGGIRRWLDARNSQCD